MPELVLASVVLIWSSTFVITKDAMTVFTPFSYLFARFLMILLLAFTVLSIQSVSRGFRTMWAIERRDLPRFVCAGVLAYTLYQLGFTVGIDNTSTFASSVLISTAPLFTLALAVLIGERHPKGAWIGMSIALAGVVIFLFDSGAGGSTLYGNLLSIGAAMAMATFWIVSRPLVARYPATTVSAFTTLFGTIPLLILGWSDAATQDWGALETRHWLMLAYMAIFPIYLVYIANNWVIAKLGVTATGANLSVPVVSGILAVVILDESLSPLKIVGAAIVLAGLILIQRSRLRATAIPTVTSGITDTSDGTKPV
ncbi:MAG: DMT family transporter [Thermomicrobiales bacterium]|nr:DMT family transporter [Thermomicrobiales bacterium]